MINRNSKLRFPILLNKSFKIFYFFKKQRLRKRFVNFLFLFFPGITCNFERINNPFYRTLIVIQVSFGNICPDSINFIFIRKNAVLLKLPGIFAVVKNSA